MKEKPYQFAMPAMATGRCVVKLTYDNKKYIIAKCKNAYDSLKRIENGLNGFIRGGVNNPEGLYFHFYNYIKKHPHKEFTLEYLSKSENPYELLICEQQALYDGLRDRRFLNNQTRAYIPLYDEINQAYGWIPAHAVLNFNNWLKKNKAPRKPVK